MNSEFNHSDYRAFKTPKKRRFTSIYLIMLGIIIGVGLTNTLRPLRNTPPKEDNPDNIDKVKTVSYAQTAVKDNIETVSAFETTVIEATRKTMPAVVSIHTSGQRITRYRFRDPLLDMLYGEQMQRERIGGMGSGVIIDPEGIIITNDHVINAGVNAVVTIIVALEDGRTFKAERIKNFPEQDIAILSIDGKNLPYIEIGSSSNITPGQTVLAIGNPFGDALTGGFLGSEPTVTRGIISATRRNLTIPGDGFTRYYRNMLQTDASINEGNSGGALIDLRGKLVGINTAIFSPRGSGSIGIGFAIPSDRVKLILDNINKNIDFNEWYTGILVKNIKLSEDQKNKIPGRGGVLVGEIVKNSPAEKSGLKSGDIIIKVNKYTVTNSDEISTIFKGSIPGELFKLSVYRDSKMLEVELELGSK